MRFKMHVLALALSVSFAMPARAALCPPMAETAVILSSAAMKAALEMLVNMLFDKFGLQLASFAKMKVTAVKTLTAQVATSAKAKINAEVALVQGEMAAVGALEQTKQQLKVYQQFSALTGQGVDPCAQLTAQTNLTLANGQAVSMAADAISHVMAAPGRYGSPEVFVEQMLRQRQLMYGTEDEAALGLSIGTKAEVTTQSGEVLPMAGADTNARVLFAESDDPLVQRARAAYLNHMAGAPDRAISPAQANSPAGREYLAAKRRKDALMSIGLNSLAMVGAEHSPNGELGGKTKVGTLRDVVGQYYGESAKDRMKGWASQAERGLKVDQVKIAAATLAVEADLLEQARRTEATLAALLALENGRSGAKDGSEALQATATSNVR